MKTWTATQYNREGYETALNVRVTESGDGEVVIGSHRFAAGEVVRDAESGYLTAPGGWYLVPIEAAFEIVTRADGNWDSDLGDDYRTYPTEQDAIAAIDGLVALGGDWTEATYGVRAVGTGNVDVVYRAPVTVVLDAHSDLFAADYPADEDSVEDFAAAFTLAAERVADCHDVEITVVRGGAAQVEEMTEGETRYWQMIHDCLTYGDDGWVVR